MFTASVSRQWYCVTVLQRSRPWTSRNLAKAADGANAQSICDTHHKLPVSILADQSRVAQARWPSFELRNASEIPADLPLLPSDILSQL